MVNPFDLIIIGGGINGAAIARDAALRGLKTILLEKDDFGSGASSKTSKLAHGGIRYLEQFQFGLVRESLKERALLLKNAPHLVRPLPFVFPVYSGDPRPLWQINLGLFLYDCMGGFGALPKHHKMQPGAILDQFPDIKSENLRGGCQFFDAQMLDNRIVIENVVSAERAGATVINHAEVMGLIKEGGTVKGVRYKDPKTGNIETLLGRLVVNATGAWTGNIAAMEPDAPHCRAAPSKGVHLLLPKFTNKTALLLHAPQDKRVFFILPWGDYSMVGTTDTYYKGDPDHVTVDSEDIEYLLEALRYYFPQLPFDKTSVISSFAGLRPLVDKNGSTDPSDVTREHVIHVSKGGLITILGGKYTTHRHIAEEVVDVVVSKLGEKQRFRPCTTAAVPLPGATGPHTLAEVEEILIKAGLKDETVKHLLGTYGTVSLEILKIIQADPSEGRVICTKHPHVFAEITYAITVEHARTPDDWFCRRTGIAYAPCRGIECYSVTAEKFVSHSE
jgi:Glycerol-3-phosphate dehydrogenase